MMKKNYFTDANSRQNLPCNPMKFSVRNEDYDRFDMRHWLGNREQHLN